MIRLFFICLLSLIPINTIIFAIIYNRSNNKSINRENIRYEKIWSRDNMIIDEQLNKLHESVEDLNDYVNIHFKGIF